MNGSVNWQVSTSNLASNRLTGCQCSSHCSLGLSSWCSPAARGCWPTVQDCCKGYRGRMNCFEYSSLGNIILHFYGILLTIMLNLLQGSPRSLSWGFNAFSSPKWIIQIVFPVFFCHPNSPQLRMYLLFSYHAEEELWWTCFPREENVRVHGTLVSRNTTYHVLQKKKT